MAEIDKLFYKLIEEGGSDLHLHETEPPKIRAHGTVMPISETAMDHDSLEAMLKEIADPDMWENYLKTGDLDFAYEMDADSRFRCNYFKQRNGFAAVFRIIPTKIAAVMPCFVVPRQNSNITSAGKFAEAATLNAQPTRKPTFSF